jgi:hypothetical protein
MGSLTPYRPLDRDFSRPHSRYSCDGARSGDYDSSYYCVLSLLARAVHFLVTPASGSGDRFPDTGHQEIKKKKSKKKSKKKPNNVTH